MALYSKSYPSQRFAHVNYALVRHPDQFHLKFVEVQDLELSSAHGYSSYIFQKRKAFQAHHSKNERLTLDYCQGISSRWIPTQVHSSYHLHWVSEHANACSFYQQDADAVVIDFYTKALIYHHWLRYHSIFIPYERRLNVEFREVWRLKFVNPREGLARKTAPISYLNQNQAEKSSFCISLKNNTYDITILMVVRRDPGLLIC